MCFVKITTKNKFSVVTLLSIVAVLSFFVSLRLVNNLSLSFFFAVAITQTVLYTYFGEAIFDWHADPNVLKITEEKNHDEKVTVRKEWIDKRKELVDKENNKKDAPAAWIIERYVHRFLGLVLGWIFFWILLNELKIFEGKIDYSTLGWTDLILFVGGWIGINGRLPTIAHDVQNWFKR